jgi:hypothetical protein
MYSTFDNDFLFKWHNPAYVETKRKEEEQKQRVMITKMNIAELERCIKKNSIDKLDRTLQYDKTFICDNFISYSYTYMNDDDKTHIDEMKGFTEIIKPELKKMFIDYTDPVKVNVKNNKYNNEYNFNSNIIPKNTFTNLSSFLLFRISNTTTDIIPEKISHTKSKLQ